MEATPNIIEKAEKAVTDILLTLPETMVYHNLNHTWEVVKAADKIGNYANLTEEEKEILMLSAWFHDTGFKFNYDNHEEKSIEIAQEFLEQNNFPAERTEKVISCIISTKIDQKPKTLTERVLNDADFIHLSKKSYFDK
ncbi:MAG: HD domain-containing protein, partial [Cyclobacteriaceae bacterium]|nr:HD domain-containing protein [Cyclobacteriaceae bacterium]